MRLRKAKGWTKTWGSPAPAPVVLITCALLPAASLFALRFVPARLPVDHSSLRLLLLICPLSTFLLAFFLWRARSQIQQLQAEQAEVVQRAGLDPLCNLPNRLTFDQHLSEAVARAGHSRPIALIAIDVDGFKQVNDGHGHRAGDRLLVGVAERLKRLVGDEDCLARLEGDEFALFLRLDRPNGCAVTVHRILDAMIAPFELGATQVTATLSLGIAIFPQDAGTPEGLKEAADLALRRAQQEGRNRFAFFDKSMEGKLHLGRTIETELLGAIEQEHLVVVYQPLVDSAGTRVTGLEALVRWHHPKLGTIPPEDFICVAERRGLINPLGEWVLRRACQDARRWPGLRIAVNVSPVQFRQRGFVDTVRTILDQTGIDAGRVELELTEGVLIQDAEQAEAAIIELRALGVRMGLDDFGSGYSSMIYLRRFAFDKIKIDRAFLEPLENVGESAIILDSIVSLGHALGLTVTAEGVEHVGQVQFLQKIGCDEMQGYYFAPPLSADAVDAHLSLQAWTAPAKPAASDLSVA